MALEMILDSIDELPEEIKAEYKERDGKFVLDVNGAFSAADRDALQTSLRKERDEHKTTRSKLKGFGEYTPETIEEIVTSRDDLQIQLDAAGGESEEDRNAKIEELVERRALGKVKPLERKLKSLTEEMGGITGERDKLLNEKRTNTILNSVTDPALLKEAGVTGDAIDDVRLWALHNFEIDEHSGKVVSKESAGTPGLSPKDVFADMKVNNQRRHWFGPTAGAGAGGGRATDSFGVNPFAKETFSLTNIGKAVKADPQKAARMAKAASTKDYDAEKYLPASLRTKKS